tara:strand:+ start:301 stop:555 length:255 start_codon:yes stop_codon:yes gene_type:complete
MEALTEYWHQILFFIGVIIMGVRLESEVKSNRRDLDHLKSELDRRDTYVETVKQRAEIDIHGKQISTLWDFVNKLRDKLNGGSL